MSEMSTAGLAQVETRVRLRPAEWVACTYFVYAAFLSLLYPVGTARLAWAFLMPLVACAAAWVETRDSRPWSRVLRKLFPTALIPAAYWQADWFRGTPMTGLTSQWLQWDHQLLEGGLTRVIEALGPVIPLVLETGYLLLYSAPPLVVVYLVATRRGDRVDRFLTTLLLGTLGVYALLPHYPVISPRLAWPGDLKPLWTFMRGLNLQVLEHLDIATSVFPSGHVGVAFSTALGLWRVLPEQRWLCWLLWAEAVIVLTATIYGRYHYAVDGLASIGVALVAWRLSVWLD